MDKGSDESLPVNPKITIVEKAINYSEEKQHIKAENDNTNYSKQSTDLPSKVSFVYGDIKMDKGSDESLPVNSKITIVEKAINYSEEKQHIKAENDNTNYWKQSTDLPSKVSFVYGDIKMDKGSDESLPVNPKITIVEKAINYSEEKQQQTKAENDNTNYSKQSTDLPSKVSFVYVDIKMDKGSDESLLVNPKITIVEKAINYSEEKQHIKAENDNTNYSKQSTNLPSRIEPASEELIKSKTQHDTVGLNLTNSSMVYDKLIQSVKNVPDKIVSIDHYLACTQSLSHKLDQPTETNANQLRTDSNKSNIEIVSTSSNEESQRLLSISTSSKPPVTLQNKRKINTISQLHTCESAKTVILTKETQEITTNFIPTPAVLKESIADLSDSSLNLTKPPIFATPKAHTYLESEISTHDSQSIRCLNDSSLETKLLKSSKNNNLLESNQLLYQTQPLNLGMQDRKHDMSSKRRKYCTLPQNNIKKENAQSLPISGIAHNSDITNTQALIKPKKLLSAHEDKYMTPKDILTLSSYKIPGGTLQNLSTLTKNEDLINLCNVPRPLKKAWLERHSGNDNDDINDSEKNASTAIPIFFYPKNFIQNPTNVLLNEPSALNFSYIPNKPNKIFRKDTMRCAKKVAESNENYSGSLIKTENFSSDQVIPNQHSIQHNDDVILPNLRNESFSIESIAHGMNIKNEVEPEENLSTTTNSHGQPPRKKPNMAGRVYPLSPCLNRTKPIGDSFLQSGPCFEVAPKLIKCRECRTKTNQHVNGSGNIFCRFYAFRRLRNTKNGQLAFAGFSDPYKDPTNDDFNLWMPNTKKPPSDLDLHMSKFLLTQVGDQFCDLLQQEKQAVQEHISKDTTVAWKRMVQGVREMCDVCETTLFNFHWACNKCGFVVCIDCYKDRKQETAKVWGTNIKDRDDFSWMLCTNRASHNLNKLMLTQIIAGDSLIILGKKLHEARNLWQIPQLCGCPLSKKQFSKAICTELVRKKAKIDHDVQKSTHMGCVKQENKLKDTVDKNKIEWLGHMNFHNKTPYDVCGEPILTINNIHTTVNAESSSDSSEDDQYSTLRKLLIRSSTKKICESKLPTSQIKCKKKTKFDTLDVVLQSVRKQQLTDEENSVSTTSKHFLYYTNNTDDRERYLPIRIMTLSESKLLYANTPHIWLCDGKLLRLLDASFSGNYKIFQEQWKRGQPVIVSGVSKSLNMELWRPESFTRDFGEEKNDLVNCMNGNLVPNQPMKKFWDGFEYINKRLKDEVGNPMLLKLKDWPPGEDFAEILPSRFMDLMHALPLGEYTQRTGRLNLAGRLPEGFVRPDLGPKMYNAYGSALHPTKGTTNLHLDISDAVNVMVYVGVARDGHSDEHIKEAFRAIDEAGCDILTRRRVREENEVPGALWHIYAARDADKIRDLLNKLAIERGARLEPNHDPIHDQSWYLDGNLRERLYKEYGVEGYPIAQCLGDAVFIPAGAPHQVRNLHNCIKVAEDFVSPENVSHCFHLTQEFRQLSETHSNHEDKLQIKNIIYHAVKDALACLSHLLGEDIPRVLNETDKSIYYQFPRMKK